MRACETFQPCKASSSAPTIYFPGLCRRQISAEITRLTKNETQCPEKEASHRCLSNYNTKEQR